MPLYYPMLYIFSNAFNAKHLQNQSPSPPVTSHQSPVRVDQFYAAYPVFLGFHHGVNAGLGGKGCVQSQAFLQVAGKPVGRRHLEQVAGKMMADAPGVPAFFAEPETEAPSRFQKQLRLEVGAFPMGGRYFDWHDHTNAGAVAFVAG